MLCEHCKTEIDTRTIRQNSSMHKWFKEVSDMFNEHGIDMRTFIREGIDIPFTPETIKSHLWKPIQEAYMQEKSTTRLKRKDVSAVYDILNKVIAERTGLHIPFPSLEVLTQNEYASNIKSTS